MEPAVTRPNDNCQTFFESIGVDPTTVIASDVSRLGYHTFVDVEGEMQVEFHQWLCGEKDWLRFAEAAHKDWLAGNLNSGIHNLIDPMVQ